MARGLCRKTAFNQDWRESVWDETAGQLAGGREQGKQAKQKELNSQIKWDPH